MSKILSKGDTNSPKVASPKVLAINLDAVHIKDESIQTTTPRLLTSKFSQRDGFDSITLSDQR